MNPRFVSRAGVAAVASLAAALVAAPAAAAPAESSACEITGGTLTWGVKESFRSYISGSIAHGSWETSDGAEYETPEFRWSDATGSLDPETGTGVVSFTGTLHFTGHDGVLDLTLANPTIEFEDDGAAALLLDARSNDMEGEVALDAQQEWVGEIALDAPPAASDGEIALDAQPVTLTNSGAGAFAGFYEAGVDLDPLALALEVDGCDADAAPTLPAEEQPPATDEPAPAAAQPPAETAPAGSDVPWLPIAVGGAALLVIGLTLGLLIGGRRSKTAAAPAGSDATTSADPAAEDAS
ncbi:HtaA domain-containing protein [Microbacterium sp. gxy059]|uniref:HtaA domain-containing protein n=1 Tax=Microbacterium sp. gxy059 TaxID=2957199 RepID=UPI003D99D9CB